MKTDTGVILTNYKMRSSSPECGTSLFYNDSGYLTNANNEPQSLSTNSELSLETSDELMIPIPIQTDLSNTNSMFFCEDAVFDEPKMDEGLPLLNDNSNNYEEFSSLFKFSLENTSSSYLHSFDDFSASSQCPTKFFSGDSLSNSSLNNSKLSAVTETTERNEATLSLPTQSYQGTITPNKYQMTTTNEGFSPELFSDNEEPEIEVPTVTQLLSKPPVIFHDERLVKYDRKLLKKVQAHLSGVPPPPAVTILQWTVSDLLEKICGNKHLFWDSVDNCSERSAQSSECKAKSKVKSFLIAHTQKDIENVEWPESLNYRYHGLHHNRSKTSEDFEFYCTKYANRYVGAETASSCTVWATLAPNSATKRRNAKLRWGIKSPGKRLSHLARRRITFSSSNLQQINANTSVIGSSAGARQFMIDARKSALLHKRKSPRKSPQKRIKTPSSSAKKRALRLALDDDSKPGPSRTNSTKRALFQSPDQLRSTITASELSATFSRNKSRRALFTSPAKSSPTKANCDRKRKRDEDECHSNKFPRSLSAFDVQHSSATGASGSSLLRTNSEIIIRPSTSKAELSDLHRKKLLWAVSEALRGQQIGMSHPQFRTYASVLCKIVKHSMPDLLSRGPRQPGSTSDRMLRIAHQHCYAVTRGKSYEEIMQQAKATSDSLRTLKPPTGYVGPVKKVLQDKVMNIETSSQKKVIKSPASLRIEQKLDENSKLKSIRRQIVFDDAEITKNCNTTR